MTNRLRNFTVKLASCFIPNRKQRKAFRQKYKRPTRTDEIKERILKLEDEVNSLKKRIPAGGGVPLPRINGVRNKIIVRENGITRELGKDEMVSGFCEILIEGNDNTLEFDLPLHAEGQPLWNNHVRMHGSGQYCKIGSTLKLHDNTFELFVDGSSLVIGKNTSIRNSYILAEVQPVKIGEQCMIAESIIRGADSHSVIDVETGKVLNVQSPDNPLAIGNRVWIAERCRILKNAGIADGCIIGAEAVVAKKFSEPNCVIAGNPAKVIKTGVTWDRESPVSYEKHGPWKYNR